MTVVFFGYDNTVRRVNNTENCRSAVFIDIIHNAVRHNNVRCAPNYCGGTSAELWIPIVRTRCRFAIDNCIAFNILLIDRFNRCREIYFFDIRIIKYVSINGDDAHYSPMGGYFYFCIASVISLDYGAAYIRAIGYKINLPFQLEKF